MQEKHITLFLSAHGSTQGDIRLDFENVKVQMFSAASSCESAFMSYRHDLGSMDNNEPKNEPKTTIIKLDETKPEFSFNNPLS